MLAKIIVEIVSQESSSMKFLETKTVLKIYICNYVSGR